MNLRKLLCGLLALCLLLTMAPAALMEESAPEEQVVELGGEDVASDAVEAEEYNAIGYDASQDGSFTLPTYKNELNSSTYLAQGEDLEIEADEGYYFISAVSKNTRLAEAEWTDDTVTITANDSRTGKARVDIKMGRDGSKITSSFVVNVVVYDETTPAAIELFDADGDKLPSTVSVDMIAGGLTVIGSLVPDVAGDIHWSSSKTKVADVAKKLTINGEANGIILKGKGTATITAKCGSVKKTLKVKVSDEFAPKSIKIHSDPASGKVSILSGGIGIYSVISPRPYADMFVEYTLDNTKYFVFAGANDTVKTATIANGLVDGDGRTWLLPTGKTGKVKITAKTYNGKKSSMYVEATDPYTVSKIDMYGFYNKETYTAELYNEDWTVNPESPRKNAFLIVPEVYANNILLEAGDPGYDWEVGNVKWESSNKKVATIGIYKSFEGYFQDEDDVITDFFGNEVYDALLDYAALVEIKGTGTTTLTCKSRDGKKSFSIKLKVVDSHKATDIVLLAGNTVTVPVDEVIDLNEYFAVYPADVYGKVTAAPTHASSKVEALGGSVILTKKTGDVTIKVKAGDKSKTFTLKIK